MLRWKPVGVVAEGQPILINAVNPWDHEWNQTGDPAVELPHPNYPAQRHRMNVFQIKQGGTQITFAAGELSANVWGFYVPA